MLMIGSCIAVILKRRHLSYFLGRNTIWIIRPMQGNKVDYFLVIDANRGLILDSEELHPAELTSETLKMCSGPSVYQVRID